VRELVDYIAQVLVQHPDQLELREDDEGLLLVVADEDLGSVVGPGGKTARALRSVLAAARGPDLEITSRSDEGSDDGSGADGDPDED
jgi:predicted RNA-binding protein YlqC (UPF0109 family)